MQLVSTSKRINVMAKENMEVQYYRPPLSKKKYLSVHSQRQSQFLINQSHKKQNMTHSPTVERKARLHLTCLSTPKAIYKRMEFHSIKSLSQPIFQLIISYVGLSDSINFLNSCRDFRFKRLDRHFQQAFAQQILKQGIRDTKTCLRLISWSMEIRQKFPNQQILSTIPCKIQQNIIKQAILFSNGSELPILLKKIRILHPHIRISHGLIHLSHTLSNCLPQNTLLTILDSMIKKLSLDKIYKGGSETNKIESLLSHFTSIPTNIIMKKWIQPLFSKDVFKTQQWLSVIVAAMCLGWTIFGTLLLYLLSGKKSYQNFIKLIDCQDTRVTKLSVFLDNRVQKKPVSQSRQRLTPLGAKRHSHLAYPISKNQRIRDSILDITCITDVRDSSFCTL